VSSDGIATGDTFSWPAKGDEEPLCRRYSA